MPTPHDVLFFASRAELHEWFVRNHATAAELWVGFHRKRSGRPTITWQELVDEELCFGWIDSVRYSLDEESSAQRITPRRRRSVWSAVNTRRFLELESAGRVHPSGRKAFDARTEDRSGVYSYENGPPALPADMEAAFRAHPAAWEYFSSQAPWYRRTATHWVVSAKRDETRVKRLRTLIDDSAAGRRLRQLARPQAANQRSP